MAKMDGFGNTDHGRALFDERRSAVVSEINLTCQELGMGVTDALLNTTRFEVLQDFLIGKIEFEADEDGVPLCVASSGDRMEFEYAIMCRIRDIVKTQGQEFVEEAGLVEARAQLIVPGGRDG